MKSPRRGRPHRPGRDSPRTWLLPLALTILFTGCKTPPATSPPPRGQRPLRFGMIPFNDLPILYKECKVVADYLSKHLGRPIRFVLVPDYGSMKKLLIRERVDLAWLTPATFIRFRKELNYELLCSPIRNGRRHHRGVIVVRADSPYQRIEDLRGKRFAYVDRLSTTGFLYPNHLLEERGIDPLSFFHDVRFSYNHTTSLEGVIDGRYDGAAVYDGAAAAAADRIDPKLLRVIARTALIPPDPIVVHAKLPADLKRRLGELFLAMPSQQDGKRTLERLKEIDDIDAFVATRDEEYCLPRSANPARGAPSAAATTGTTIR